MRDRRKEQGERRKDTGECPGPLVPLWKAKEKGHQRRSDFLLSMSLAHVSTLDFLSPFSLLLAPLPQEVI